MWGLVLLDVTSVTVVIMFHIQFRVQAGPATFWIKGSEIDLFSNANVSSQKGFHFIHSIATLKLDTVVFKGGAADMESINQSGRTR